MSNELKAAIQKWCEKLEIPLLGVASVDRWKEPPFQPWMPEEFYPQSIYPEARSVIVIGLPISLPVLETSPSVYYRELYSTVNSLLDQYPYRLASYLTQLGHPSVFA
jgi:epoxyqueuosine reductase QueG